MSDYCPGAVLDLQGNGGGLDTSLPPRFVWHITWDALKPDGSQPQFSAVDNYLQNVGYCPHIMWNPFTGYIKQYYPASQSARALAAWNGDGEVCVQIEVFFTPGCVVNGVRYDTVADTPLKGFGTLLAWADSLGVPRVWPMGAPGWTGNSRDASVWNGNAGHYGHCNVPDNTHTDPGPMPSLTGISTQSTTITPMEDDMPSLQEIAQAVWGYRNGDDRDAYQRLRDLPGDVMNTPVPYRDPVTGEDTGHTTSLATVAGFTDFNHVATRTALPAAVLNQTFTLPDGTVTNLAGILAAIHAAPAGVGATATTDPQAVVRALATQLNK
jgi:hypothetical protein